MPCHSPLIRCEHQGGRISFHSKTDNEFISQTETRRNEIGCGSCMGCRMRKRLDWTIRASHELQMNDGVGAFITLTFDDAKWPHKRSIDKADLQKFFKRFRKNSGSNIRYFACGEYGDKNRRPHYHVLMFGHDFVDKEVMYTTKVGHKFYRSPLLEKCWKFGFSNFSDVNFTTAAYTASYVQKKITGSAAADYYVCSETGEELQPEFQLASRNPAIGLSWVQKYYKDVFPSDECVLEGKVYPVPDYYKKKVAEFAPDLIIDVEFDRATNMKFRHTDIEISRLAQMEKCKILQNEKYLFNKENGL